MIAIGAGQLPRIPRRRPRDGRPLPLERRSSRTCRSSWRCSASGIATSWAIPTYAVLPYDQRLERLRRPISSSSTWRSTASASRLDGATVDGRDRADRLRRARHQRPARLLPAPPPGHRRRARAISWSPPGRTRTMIGDHHDLLIANCLAQSEALMRGRTHRRGARRAARRRARRGEIERLAPHKVFPGNRPSNTLLYPAARPATLGHAHRALRAQGLRPGRRSGGSIPSTSGASNSARCWPASSCRWSRARPRPSAATPRPSASSMPSACSGISEGCRRRFRQLVRSETATTRRTAPGRIDRAVRPVRSGRRGRYGFASDSRQ